MSARSWSFDSHHSHLGFVARHMVVARVIGRFNRFEGALQLDPEDLLSLQLSVDIDTTSIDSNAPHRDEHLRSADFLDVAHHRHATFKSTRIELQDGAQFLVHGELTLRGVTKPVRIEARKLGVLNEGQGAWRAVFSGRAFINRSDFGISWNKALDNGGWVVSERIELEFDVQALSKA